MADTPEHLRFQADRCRRLARDITDQPAREALLKLAEDYDRRAKALAPDAHKTDAPRANGARVRQDDHGEA